MIIKELGIDITTIPVDDLKMELNKRIKTHSNFDKKLAKEIVFLRISEIQKAKKELKNLAAAKTEIVKEFTRRGVVI